MRSDMRYRQHISITITILHICGNFCLLSFVFCLLSFDVCLLSFVFCLLSFVFWLLAFVFCLLSFVFCILYSVFCILYSVFCFRLVSLLCLWHQSCVKHKATDWKLVAGGSFSIDNWTCLSLIPQAMCMGTSSSKNQLISSAGISSSLGISGPLYPFGSAGHPISNASTDATS